MFGFKKDKEEEKGKAVAEIVPSEPDGLWQRLKQGLSRTRTGLTRGLATLFLGKKTIDGEVLDELETRLLTADVGVEATTMIVRDLTDRVARNQLGDVEALLHALEEDMVAMLAPCEKPLVIPADKRPYVMLMVGINGAGKTTTIGKLAKRLQSQGLKVMLAAGDTFRAAAVEQLQVWGERNNVAVIAQQRNADAASVIFDAMEAARARGVDVLIVDTAGRLHTQTNLMEELKKIKRVAAKVDALAPHETMLIIDAGIGQNALVQAKEFHDAVGLTGITLTKLDGTAKGGMVLAIAQKMRLPIRFIGVGESVDDLREFNARDFVRALLDMDDVE
jgi:fused signal recognition particle receptor